MIAGTIFTLLRVLEVLTLLPTIALLSWQLNDHSLPTRLLYLMTVNTPPPLHPPHPPPPPHATLADTDKGIHHRLRMVPHHPCHVPPHALDSAIHGIRGPMFLRRFRGRSRVDVAVGPGAGGGAAVLLGADDGCCGGVCGVGAGSSGDMELDGAGDCGGARGEAGVGAEARGEGNEGARFSVNPKGERAEGISITLCGVVGITPDCNCIIVIRWSPVRLWSKGLVILLSFVRLENQAAVGVSQTG